MTIVINAKAAKKTTKVLNPLGEQPMPADPHAEVRAAFEAGCAVEYRSTIYPEVDWSTPKLKSDGVKLTWLSYFEYRVIEDFAVYQRRVEEIKPTSPTASGPYPTWYSDGEPNIELRFIGDKLHSVRMI